MSTAKDIVKLQQEELNVGHIIDLVTAPNCGAVSSFVGITRDNFDNKKVFIYWNYNYKCKDTLTHILMTSRF